MSEPQTHRRRWAGDPRLSPEGRELFRRISSGDPVDEFQTALDGDVESDPLLGGRQVGDDIV